MRDEGKSQEEFAEYDIADSCLCCRKLHQQRRDCGITFLSSQFSLFQ